MATITGSSAAQIQLLISCNDVRPSVLVTIPHIKKRSLGSQKPTPAQPHVQMS